MLQLESFNVITEYNLDSLVVQWEFVPSNETLMNYSINVYRSESSNILLDEYICVASGISANTYYHEDTTISGWHDFTRTWYYKLKIVNDTTNEYSVVPELPVRIKSVNINYITKEIIRRKRLVLQQKSGRDFYILKKYTQGVHCPMCWDVTLFKTTDPDCETCAGTGWTTGYYNALSIRGMSNAAPKYNQINMFGDWMPSDVLFYCLGFPLLRPKDIIVDDINRRWIVVQIRTIEHLGYIIEQNAQLALIAPDDYIYKIGVS